jgi:hypothetical protein
VSRTCFYLVLIGAIGQKTLALWDREEMQNDEGRMQNEEKARFFRVLILHSAFIILHFFLHFFTQPVAGALPRSDSA